MGMRDVVFPSGSVFLVTGAAGFIGSNICEALIDMGCRVRALDNLSTGRLGNIKTLLSSALFEFVEGDITESEVCLHACRGVTYVLHQAALGSVPRSMEFPLIYESNNIAGTANMMDAALRQGVKRFVYASSSSVYGDSAELPKIEGREGAELSPYALTKKINEEYASLYTRVFGLPCIGLRYFNVFGRRQDPNSQYSAVIPKFIAALKRGERVEFYGDGTQSRDFTYIDNVIEANLKACLAGKEADGKAFNIAFGQRFTLLEMYGLMCSLLGLEREPRFMPERPGDVKHSLADISRARTLLGYDPSYDFESGFRAALEWYNDNWS